LDQALEKRGEVVKTTVHPEYRVPLKELREIGPVHKVLCNAQ